MTQLFRALVVRVENLGSISTFGLTTYVLGDPMPLLVSMDTRHTWYTDWHAGKIPTHLILKSRSACLNVFWPLHLLAT